MNKTAKFRLWLEAVLAAVTGSLFVLTLISREWIEILFQVEPDRGNGSLEGLIVAILLALTFIFSNLALLEWRRLRTGEQNLPG